ncbi:MAG: hypothetical protein IPO06_29580 [Leptospiraceae bacterium]|nr:hypothetical protein [Leptospiraceae bacterium]MBP6738356.1 hypothetical protein [Leptospiraceae bacterium]
MARILNDDIVKTINELHEKKYQRPHIKKYLESKHLVDKIGLSTISRALSKKNLKSFSKDSQ